MTLRCLPTISVLLFGLLALKRLPAQAPVSFEVATVKPSDPKAREVGLYTYPGGRIIIHSYTLRDLLIEAFHLQRWQIEGGPAWASTDSFDIVAQPSSDSDAGRTSPASPKSPPSAEQRLMLQSLLVERFHVRVHRSSKEGLVYLLTKGDKDLKLQPPKDPKDFPWAGGVEGGAISHATGVEGRNISMPQLAVRLTGFMRHPVQDHTRITGSYDFRYLTGNEDEDADLNAAIISSIRAIGLRLVPSKGVVETLVIDAAEKPTEN